MKIGAHFTTEDFPVFIESVKRLEASGYDRAWLVDSQMLWEDGYVYFTRGLEATQRIAFGTAVSNPVTRHYTVSASAAATLARLHPGRVILGMGRGDSAVRTLGFKPMATGRMTDILSKTKALMAGEPVQEDGAEIRIRWADQKVPLMYAATGPRNLRLGGALADIVMLQVGTHADAIRWAVGHVRAGAEEAGRDPAEVEIAALCAMWVSDDMREALDACRWAAACAANHLEDVVRHNPSHNMPDELKRVVEVRRDHYDYYAGHLDSSAEHTQYLSDELIDDFAIAGPASRCLKRIAELKELGITEVSTAYLNGQLDQIERVGREVIAALN